MSLARLGRTSSRERGQGQGRGQSPFLRHSGGHGVGRDRGGGGGQVAGWNTSRPVYRRKGGGKGGGKEMQDKNRNNKNEALERNAG